MTSLKELYCCHGMKNWTERVNNATTLDGNLTAQHPGDKRHRIYWEEETMAEEGMQRLKVETHAAVCIDDMY